MMKYFPLVLSFIGTLLAPHFALAQKPASSEKSVKYKDFSQLQQKQWRRILLYTPTWLGGERSIVDDNAFFMEPSGKWNPEKEWNVFYRSLEALENAGRDLSLKESLSPKDIRCRFPNRWTFAQERRKEAGLEVWPSPNCTHLNYFLSRSVAQKVALSFASLYPGGPSSMFGHTFLRLFKNDVSSSQGGMGFHDVSFNYAAVPDSNGPIDYMLKGLFGGFGGALLTFPLYYKIQEYSQAEQRDIWEYRLNFSPEEIQWIVRGVWEIAPHKIDYYYFDDNCAFVMLQLMEMGRPSLDFVYQFPFWVVPSDTVRAVYDTPNLVENVAYYPSTTKKSSLRLANLDPLETQFFEILVDKRDSFGPSEVCVNAKQTHSKCFDSLTDAQKRKILDALLDHLDSQFKVSGTLAPKAIASIRTDLLSQRAAIGGTTEKVSPQIPWNESPHRAHKSHQLGVGVGLWKTSKVIQSPVTLIKWRPALTSPVAASRGLSRNMSIGFMDTEIHARNQSVDLHKFTLFEVNSMEPWQEFDQSTSWRLHLGFERTSTPRVDSEQISLGGAMGFTVGSSAWQAFSRAGTAVGTMRIQNQKKEWNPYLGPQLALGTLAQGKKWRVVLQGSLARNFTTQDTFNALKWEQKISYFPLVDWEIWGEANQHESLQWQMFFMGTSVFL